MKLHIHKKDRRLFLGHIARCLALSIIVSACSGDYKKGVPIPSKIVPYEVDFSLTKNAASFRLEQPIGEVLEMTASDAPIEQSRKREESGWTRVTLEYQGLDIEYYEETQTIGGLYTKSSEWLLLNDIKVGNTIPVSLKTRGYQEEDRVLLPYQVGDSQRYATLYFDQSGKITGIRLEYALD